MFLTLQILLALLEILVYAYPQITSPTAGASLPGGVAFTVSWAESGESPLIDNLINYELYLYTGANTNPQQIYAITRGTFVAGNSISASIPLAVGGSVKNAYFLGLVSTATEAQSFTSFSNRFTLTGMTGTFPPAVNAALEQVSSITGPGFIKNAAAVSPGDDPYPAEDLWEIPYNLQTGLTKYAPMQPIPPTAITATNTKALWPTSAVQFAKALMPNPTQVTTIIQSQTFSVLSHANTAAPAPQPSNDMQKFLNRWKD